MRGMRNWGIGGLGALFAILGAVVALAIVVGSDLPAAARSVSFPPPNANNQTVRVDPKVFDAALATLVAGGQTIGGPGTFADLVNSGDPVYQVLTGPAPNVCITVRALPPSVSGFSGNVRVSVAGASSVDIEVGKTRTACYGAPTEIRLECQQLSCAAVWRVDEQ